MWILIGSCHSGTRWSKMQVSREQQTKHGKLLRWDTLSCLTSNRIIREKPPASVWDKPKHAEHMSNCKFLTASKLAATYDTRNHGSIITSTAKHPFFQPKLVILITTRRVWFSAHQFSFQFWKSAFGIRLGLGSILTGFYLVFLGPWRQRLALYPKNMLRWFLLHYS
jgi:hypothetical protein